MGHSDYIKRQVQSNIRKGIEIWQANFKMTPKGVELESYFETTSDFIEGGAAFQK